MGKRAAVLKLSLRSQWFLASFTPVSCMLVALILASRSTGTQGTATMFSLGAVAGVVTALVAGWVLSSRVCHRVEQLIQSAELVAAGVHIKSLDTSGDELGQLSSALVEMSRHVIEQKAQIHEVSARLQAVLRATKDVSILAENLEGRITICNPGAERMLGYRQQEVMGRRLCEIVHPREAMQNHGEQTAALRSAKKQALDDAAPDHENIYVRKDGLCLDVQLSIAPMKDMQGQTVGFLHVANDISPRKVLESELRHRNEELKKQAHDYGESGERVSKLLQTAQGAATPLKTLQRLLPLLQQSVTAESELNLIYQCRELAESAASAIQQLGAFQETGGDAPSCPVMLPELLRMSSAIKEEDSTSLKEVDQWYGRYGEIPSSAEQQGKRDKILVVDDFDATRTLMRVYLQDLNCDLDFADNGQTALGKIAMEGYRLVLMDIEMPGMDGNETARRVRAWEREQGRAALPLIAMTAHSDHLEGGSAECVWTSSLHKPLTKGQLLRELGKHLKQERSPSKLDA